MKDFLLDRIQELFDDMTYNGVNSTITKTVKTNIRVYERIFKDFEDCRKIRHKFKIEHGVMV